MKIKLVVHYRVPSLNALFKLNHWQRAKERKKAHLALLSALGLSAIGYLTPTTSAQNRSLTASATLASYLVTGQMISSSRSARRSAGRKRSEPK